MKQGELTRSGKRRSPGGKRFFALMLAALLTLTLLPAGVLAAGYNPEKSGNRSLSDFLCGDGDCMTLGCKGEGDPAHGTSGTESLNAVDLNLSSEGKNVALDIPVKPGMTINDIPWLPDYGPKGHAFINVKDLQAAQLGGALVGTLSGFNPSDLAIAHSRLYIDDSVVNGVLESLKERYKDNIDEDDEDDDPVSAAEENRRRIPDSLSGDFTPESFYYDVFDTIDPAVASSLTGKKYVGFDVFYNQMMQDISNLMSLREGVFEAISQTNSPMNLKGEQFEIAVNGKPVLNCKVNNVWQDKPVPYYDPSYDAASPSQKTQGPVVPENP